MKALLFMSNVVILDRFLVCSLDLCTSEEQSPCAYSELDRMHAPK